MAWYQWANNSIAVWRFYTVFTATVLREVAITSSCLESDIDIPAMTTKGR